MDVFEGDFDFSEKGIKINWFEKIIEWIQNNYSSIDNILSTLSDKLLPTFHFWYSETDWLLIILNPYF